MDSPEFASLARSWDRRARLHCYLQLQQPVSAHQVLMQSQHCLTALVPSYIEATACAWYLAGGISTKGAQFTAAFCEGISAQPVPTQKNISMIFPLKPNIPEYKTMRHDRSQALCGHRGLSPELHTQQSKLSRVQLCSCDISLPVRKEHAARRMGYVLLATSIHALPSSICSMPHWNQTWLHVQNKVEKCAIYAQQQAALQSARATQIQAAWRGLATRRRIAALQAEQAQQGLQAAAATLVQARGPPLC